MKILLQNLRNKFYFRCGNAWTSDPDAAHDFESAGALFEFVASRKLRDVQAVLKLADSERCEPVSLELWV
ncbi:MAG TPA: hypothetical protein VLT36_18750 [Candidatus Dormibacteraeota bacterium]|nr:hypothetical protein [Candidatus Dormibacteraeota bacterium]